MSSTDYTQEQDILRLAIVQIGPIYLNPEENMHKIDSLLRDLEPIEDNPIDLLLLPEMWDTGFITEEAVLEPDHFQKSAAYMQELAERYQTAVFGSMIYTEGQRRYNRGLWIFPDGLRRSYDKMHLFAPGGEAQHYSPGKERLLLHYKGWKIFPAICYDLRFPVWSRYSSSRPYDLLLYIACWPQLRRDAWRVLLQARAAENLAYVAASNRVGVDQNGLVYSGESMLIDPKLSHIAELYPGEPGILYATASLSELRETRRKFPALQDADPFTLHTDAP